MKMIRWWSACNGTLFASQIIFYSAAKAKTRTYSIKLKPLILGEKTYAIRPTAIRPMQ